MSIVLIVYVITVAHAVSANYASVGIWRDSLQRIPPIGYFLVEIRGAGPCRASTGFMFASGGDLSEGYRHGGPRVCLGDGQMEAEGVP